MTNHTIKEIIQIMSNLSDEKTIQKYENLLSYKFALPILIFGGTMNFIMMGLVLGNDLQTTGFNSIFLLVIALLFSLNLKYGDNETLKANIFTFLFISVFIFIVVRFYSLIGPSIWSVSLILIMISMLHIKRSMLILLAITFISMGAYVTVNHYQYDMNVYYYATQTISFFVLFIIASTVHKIIVSRFDMVLMQYQHLFTSEEKLKLTLSSVGDGVITVDADGKVEFMNAIAEEMTGWSQHNAVGSPIESIFQIVNETAKTKLLIHQNGSERVINDTTSPIRNRKNKIIGSVIVFKDYTQLNDERKQIEYLSYHDQLTGLYNRRFYEEELNRFDTLRNLPMSFIYGDVNGLKIINDAFGHQVGDQLISRVANVLSSECRSDDIISRIGGDEFVILLPKTSLDEANSMLQRIQTTIAGKKIMNIDISVSFGCSTKIQDDVSTLEILKKAEDQMYQQKILEHSNHRSDVIRSIIKMLYIKSPQEKGHSQRVSLLCESIGKAMNMNDFDIQELKLAGELHDIGKIAVNKTILNKPAKLSRSQWLEIHKHPETGFRLLSTSTEYHNIARYIHGHHERWDGTGYPLGLEGNEIYLKTRILSLANAYDAMTSKHSYSDAITTEQAIKEVQKNANTQFDPHIVDVLVKQVLSK